MEFTIVSLTIEGEWCYDLPKDVNNHCSHCKKLIYESGKYNYTVDSKIPPVILKCNCIFHSDCLKGATTCPTHKS